MLGFRSAIYIAIIAIVAGLIYNRGFAQTLFERDLYYGLKNDSEVLRLQRFLVDEGVYEGPVTGNFFKLTLEGVKRFQSKEGISPISGYVGPKTRAVLNSRLVVAPKSETPEQLLAKLLAQVKELERQLAIAKVREAAPPVVSPAPTPPPVAAVPVGPYSSSLKINVTLQNYSSARYLDIPLNELRLTADNNEDAAITRIKFTNNGTLADANFIEIKITRVQDGVIIARLRYQELLAMAANFKNKAMELIFTADPSKPDKGLMRSGHTYNIIGSLLTPNTTLKPTIQLDIASAADIDVRGYNDLTRVADISKMNTFPIIGPIITLQ